MDVNLLPGENYKQQASEFFKTIEFGLLIFIQFFFRDFYLIIKYKN